MRTALISMAVGAVLTGCAERDDETVDKGDPVALSETRISLEDVNNYAWSPVYDFPAFTTASGVDLEICWDAVELDLGCDAIDPAMDVTTASLVRFPEFTESEVETSLSSNTTAQTDIDLFVEVASDAGTSCIRLSALGLLGTPFLPTEEYVEGGGTYLLMLSSQTEPGVDPRVMAILEPDAASSTTTVELGDSCGDLDVDSDLAARTTVSVPEAAEGTVDWSALTRTGTGADWPDDIDRLTLYHFDELTTAELADQALLLDSLATAAYSLDLSGSTSAELADIDGFSGFASTGTWLLALDCSSCVASAPAFLGVLAP